MSREGAPAAPTRRRPGTRPKRLPRTLWHPHQGFWNKDIVTLLTRPTTWLNHLVLTEIVALDTAILFLRALRRRVAVGGIAAVAACPRLPASATVVYLDLGTHRDATELRWMVKHVLPRASESFDAYGFEASERSFRVASRDLGELPGVELFHVALVHDVPGEGTVRLYRSARSIADSLHRTNDSYEEVPARRLSDWLVDRRIDLDHAICLLRMNIEGAEFDVLRDLVEQGLAHKVDGYYGMWDDLSKLDEAGDRGFRAYLDRHGIHPLTFNGRDMAWGMRRWCIRYDVGTSLLVGQQRLAGRRRV